MRLGPRLIRHGCVAALAAMTFASPAVAIVGASSDGAAITPFVVMVLNHQGRTAGYCSGIVVTQDVVLTAAHCVPVGAAVKVHYRDDDGAPVLLDIADIARSPAYRADAIAARARSVDLALVRLRAPLPARFHPAALTDPGPTSVGRPFRLAGFGLRREGEASSSGTLRIAEVTTRAPLSNVLLWARSTDGRPGGACTGDSGGPVLEAGDDKVVGLMAWSAGMAGAACGDLTQAIWLAPQRQWIDGVLAGWARTAH